MPTYKLIYFDAKGRAEPSRLLFKLAGAEFEDNRVKREDWPELKQNLPHGQLPVLEIEEGGKKQLLTQSYAIHFYLADELGFTPASSLDRSRVIEVVETIRDLSPTIGQIFAEQDETKKAELRRVLEEEKIPKVIGVLEKRLAANGNNLFVGSKVSLADVYVFSSFFDFLPAVLGKKPGEHGSKESYPTLAKFMKSFHDLPQIKKWLETRPVTGM